MGPVASCCATGILRLRKSFRFYNLVLNNLFVVTLRADVGIRLVCEAQKDISIRQDETVHPETCLIASEPVSNFILSYGAECGKARQRHMVTGLG